MSIQVHTTPTRYRTSYQIGQSDRDESIFSNTEQPQQLPKKPPQKPQRDRQTTTQIFANQHYVQRVSSTRNNFTNSPTYDRNKLNSYRESYDSSHDNNLNRDILRINRSVEFFRDESFPEIKKQLLSIRQKIDDNADDNLELRNLIFELITYLRNESNLNEQNVQVVVEPTEAEYMTPTQGRVRLQDGAFAENSINFQKEIDLISETADFTEDEEDLINSLLTENNNNGTWFNFFKNLTTVNTKEYIEKKQRIPINKLMSGIKLTEEKIKKINLSLRKEREAISKHEKEIDNLQEFILKIEHEKEQLKMRKQNEQQILKNLEDKESKLRELSFRLEEIKRQQKLKNDDLYMLDGRV